MGCPVWHEVMYNLIPLFKDDCGSSTLAVQESDGMKQPTDYLFKRILDWSWPVLGQEQVLRGSRNFLCKSRQEHQSIDRLRKKKVKKKKKKSKTNQTNKQRVGVGGLEGGGGGGWRIVAVEVQRSVLQH